MKVWRMTLLYAIGLVLALSSSGQAALIDVTITKDDAELGPSDGSLLADQTITFWGLNPNATSDATITFSVRGDFEASAEHVILSMDGLSFGTWLNDNLSDDTIFEGTGDTGYSDYAFVITGAVSDPSIEFLGRVTDGQLDFFFDYSNSVHDFSTPDLAQVRVQYEAMDPPCRPPQGSFSSALAWRPSSVGITGKPRSYSLIVYLFTC